MLNNNIMHILIISIFILSYKTPAISFRSSSITADKAIISFKLDMNDKINSPISKNIFIALSSLPGITVRGQITEEHGIFCPEKSLRTLTNGWKGNNFIQWFSFTYRITDKNMQKSTEAGGVITFYYSKPILKTGRYSQTGLKQKNIISLPVKNLFFKRDNIYKPNIPYRHGLRMEIPLDGIYQITGKELAHSGVPIKNIRTSSYRLFCEDKEIPIFITDSYKSHLDPDNKILFYGKMLRGKKRYYTQYSNINVYWLVWNTDKAGIRIAEAFGWWNKDPFSFDSTGESQIIIAKEYLDTLHIEEDNDIRWLGDIFNIEEIQGNSLPEDDIDNWHWGFIGDNKLTNFTFPVPSPIKSNNLNVILRVALSGLTSIVSNPQDHQFSIQINSKSTNSPHAVWDGQNSTIFLSRPFEAYKLEHGTNTITFIKIQHDSIPDRAVLNWIELICHRNYQALDNKLYFKNSINSIRKWLQFNLDGFSSDKLDLWDISKYRKFTDFRINSINKSYTLLFQDSITQKTVYYAQAQSLRLSPQNMGLDTISDRWDFTEGLDYIIITKSEFIPVLLPLAEVHRESGLKVKIFDIQDIYNRFSYGIHNPESIRLMLKYIFNKNFSHPPKYLLLAGDATHDMYKKERYRTIVPTHLTRVPSWGPASDDGYFTLVNGNDNFSDLYVGRLPARTTEEMQLLVDKTVNYLLHLEHGLWKDNLIIAGGVEPDFTEMNNQLMTQIIGSRMNILRMDAYPKSPYYTNSSIASVKMAGLINAGAYALNFAGHGGGNVWSDSKFFSFNDLSKLHNSQWSKSGRLPIIFSFTCLTGFFESAFYESLGENFLRQSKNGCISFYGASGYTKRSIDIAMDKLLLENAMNNRFESLGELLDLTEMLMLVSHGSEALPLIRQYNLLGDPAIPWKLTEDTLKLSISDSNLKNTDSLVISCNTLPIISGKLKLTLFADNSIIWGNEINSFTNGSLKHTFHLKKNTQTAKGIVRAFAWNDSAELVGWACFSKDTFTLRDVSIFPTGPSVGDSVFVTCRTFLRDSLYTPTIQCRYTVDNPNNQNIIFDENASVFMEKEFSSNLWKARNNIVPYLPESEFDINKQLILKFFATGNIGASDFFCFKLKGRPDLLFTSDTLYCSWENDSIYICAEILNKGNIASPSFSITFIKQSTLSSDTLYHGYSNTTLLAGRTLPLKIAIADMIGNTTIIGELNINHSIRETDYSNNTTIIPISVTYADLHLPSDTLISEKRGCRLIPSDTLSSTYRVFLFNNIIKENKPLLSKSEWLDLSDDGKSLFYIRTRPLLNSGNQLKWLFFPKDTEILKNTDSVWHAGIFMYDTSSEKWLNRGGIIDTINECIILDTDKQGPFSLGKHTDNTPPEIRVFINGKEILYIDYAAKNKPFNIFITDSSGINIPSIQIFLNGKPLTYEHKSSAISGDPSSTVTLTAYPVKMNIIDSLMVIAEDNAGNMAEKVFLYRPGENLKIRFFSCHPNPFSGKAGRYVRFAYLLTDAANSVSLTIYTISGRKVWRYKKNGNIIGYQEIRWDGTTQNNRIEGKGFRIANGTYYAKLIAKNSRKKVKKIIRIAKLEGY